MSTTTKSSSGRGQKKAGVKGEAKVDGRRKSKRTADFAGVPEREESSSEKVRVRVSREGARRPWQENLESYKAPPQREPELPKVEIPTPDWKKVESLARVISQAAKVANAYEIQGEENIPSEGGALFVFYHGLVPLDAWYFGAEYFLRTGRLVRGLGDNFVFKTPGLAWLARSMGALPGSPETAISLLKSGELVGVSPGGVREAISGTQNNYRLIWGERKGFAKVAIEAGVPILPAFTSNVEEMYRAPFAATEILQAIYDKTRLPLVPIMGMGPLPFPVKLTSWIGEPVYPKKGEEPGELVLRVRSGVQTLIDQHQPRKQQSILSALRNRFGF